MRALDTTRENSHPLNSMQSVIVKPFSAVGFALLALVHCASAEIALSESLAVEGLVDLYGGYRDAEPQVGASESEALDIDQLSLSFLFESAAYSGQLDVAHEGTDDGRGLLLEQLFVALPFAEGTLTLGQYASMLGFEAFDPMALYQSSTAYDMDLSGIFRCSISMPAGRSTPTRPQSISSGFPCSGVRRK